MGRVLACGSKSCEFNSHHSPPKFVKKLFFEH